MKNVTQQQAHVKPARSPRNGGWVGVKPDGVVYRWARFDGIVTTFVSRDAFLTPEAAARAAATVADCYGVEFVGTAWAGRRDGLTRGA